MPAPALRATATVRPDQTARLMAETGLDEAILRRMVRHFYVRVRADPVLGPIFAARIADWGRHLERMAAFWSSVALMTGRYHAALVPAHAGLPVNQAHFDRWLALFRRTAQEICPPAGAAHLILRAERIAQALHLAVQDHRLCGAPPRPGLPKAGVMTRAATAGGGTRG